MDYRIPALWNCWDAPVGVISGGKQIAIDAPVYLAECLRWIEGNGAPAAPGRSLSRIRRVVRGAVGQVRTDDGPRRAGDWIRRGFMYGMMIRCATAWDHDGDGKLTGRRVNEFGTFLKSILLLPHLQKMGVDVLYLLPVVNASRLYRKGELGCPYAAKNFMALDPDQYDDAFGADYGDVDDQFRLFVTCAHRLGMRVMLDLAPRTAARDCAWILERPDWFYWIDRRFERGYRAPHIPNVTYYNPVPGRLDEVYGVPAVREHLAKFRFAPNVTAPQKWANFAAAQRRRPAANLLTEIARHFGVVTPPGFSDVVNDTQPPWSDVTYFRLFEDHPVEAVPHLPDPAAQPPYVLYDTAKASMFEGRRPMKQLWDRLANILPFYQGFGVDGARVDMAHALPNRLEAMILQRPRKKDPDFCLLAEQLGTENHARVYRGGYNIIIGPSWWMQPRGHEGQMHAFVAQTARLKVPVMAAAETPDTPRAVVRRGRRAFAMQAAVVNCFLPNAVPMINCGMEVHERQPMNLGLDAKPRDRFALPKSDPLYGKLAFFDRYALHWTNPGGAQMTELIARASTLRREYLPALTNPRAYFAPNVTMNAKHVLATAFKLPRRQGTLLMLANLDYQRARRTKVADLPGSRGACELLLTIHGAQVPRSRRGALHFDLAPGDALVVRAI
ncbi:MAG TPA: alpha-amylase family glycosyl hydrolase [Phycisphaerae bacterium]|nr:alpha-amylase [Phycisphaerales bacterium]HRX84504.1 alpha-amylase family glycosyl hydrolase [Phycisphaerae bacterium]